MKLYTVKDVALMLGFREATIRKKIFDGEIKKTKITGSNAVRVSQEEIDRLIGKEEQKMTDKEKLLERIKAMPDDIQVFTDSMEYDVIDVRIFTIPKDERFIRWYFGIQEGQEWIIKRLKD